MPQGVFCAACGSPLQDGIRFCAHCGTLNEPAKERTPVIDAAPLGNSLSIATATSDSNLKAKTMPIVVGKHTTLEGVERAVKPEPVPWAEPRSDRPDAGDAPTTPLRGRERIGVALLVVASLLIVPTIGCTWTYQNLHDPAKVASLFGDLHRRPDVARPLGQAVADGLVADSFVKPSARADAMSKATTYIESPGFERHWAAVLRATQYQAVEAAGGSAQVTELDLTPVVDHLRYDGVAASNSTMSPVVLAEASSRKMMRRNGLLLTFGALLCGPLALIFFIIGIALVKDRVRALGVFSRVLTAWALISVLLAFVVPGVLAGTASSPATRPLHEAAVHVLAIRLAALCAVIFLFGTALVVVTTVILRRRRPLTYATGSAR